MKKLTMVTFGIAIMAVAMMLMPLTTMAQVQIQCPADLDPEDSDGDGNGFNDHLCLHLTAGDGYLKMADGRDLYMFGFGDVTGVPEDMVMMAGMLGAAFPAPRIVVREGQKLYLTLTNVGMMIRPDLFDPHSVHFHGFPNAAPIFDGVPDASISIEMMSSLTYFYNIVEPGTHMYHCHVEATEHMQMGMLGNLYVEPRQNMLPNLTDLDGFTHLTGNKYVFNDQDGSSFYDVDYAIQLSAMDHNFHDASETVQPLPFALMKDTYPMLNGRGYPDTINTSDILNIEGRPSQKEHSLITAVKGQKVLLRLSSLSTTEYYSISAQGIPMKVIGKGSRQLRGPDPDGNGPLLGQDLSYYTTSVNLGGGESVEVILETAAVNAGTYLLHTTNLHNLSNNLEDFGGMMTEIIITE